MTIREMIKELEEIAKIHGENIKVGYFGEDRPEEVEEICFHNKGCFFGDLEEDTVIIY